jgi:hypothetical protein
MHIIGQTRLDTWQTARRATSSDRIRHIHQPIQVQGKARIDTWQTAGVRRRAHSATTVGHP